MLREAKGVTVELKKKMLGPYVYRVSTSRTRYWEFECPNHAQEQTAQLTTPVLIGKTQERGALWWCQNRYYWDTEGLSQADVLALLVQRQQRKQATLERAHAGTVGSSTTSGRTSEAARRRLLKEEEQERKQRLLEERAADVEGRNASLEATISTLENLLREALDRDSTVVFDPDDGDPEALVRCWTDAGPLTRKRPICRESHNPVWAFEVRLTQRIWFEVTGRACRD